MSEFPLRLAVRARHQSVQRTVFCTSCVLLPSLSTSTPPPPVTASLSCLATVLKNMVSSPQLDFSLLIPFHEACKVPLPPLSGLPHPVPPTTFSLNGVRLRASALPDPRSVRAHEFVVWFARRATSPLWPSAPRSRWCFFLLYWALAFRFAL